MAQTLYTTRQARLKRLIEAKGLSGTAPEIAATLNTPEQTGTRRVTMAEVQNALVARGKALAIASFLADPPAEHKTVARIIEFFLSGKQEDFNPFDTSADDLFNVLMMLGLVDADDVAHIKDLGRVMQTPAEQAGLGAVSEQEVAEVLDLDI